MRILLFAVLALFLAAISGCSTATSGNQAGQSISSSPGIASGKYSPVYKLDGYEYRMKLKLRFQSKRDPTKENGDIAIKIYNRGKDKSGAYILERQVVLYNGATKNDVTGSMLTAAENLWPNNGRQLLKTNPRWHYAKKDGEIRF